MKVRKDDIYDIIGKMIDFNAHILTGFSDGPKTVEESCLMLKKLARLGFSEIVCTPRYSASKNNYVSASEKQQKVSELELVAKYNGVPMKLFLANEVFLMPNISELIKKGEVSILSKKYVLVKLPEQIPEQKKISLKKIEKVLIKLRSDGYVPILVNPEKSQFLQVDATTINKLAGTGALFLCSFKTMAGINGKEAEALMNYMLTSGFVDFLGTDVSGPEDELFEKFDKALKKLEKMIGISGIEKIMRNTQGVL